MSQPFTLYDLPRRDSNTCWSPNVWKTRLVLNYKSIPYKTKWLAHPEIAPALQALGLPPNAPGPHSDYTLPTIQLPDGTPVMDSPAIAAKLETLYPQRPLHLDNGLPEKLEALIPKCVGPLVPVFMPRIGREVIREDSVPYFQEQRAKRFGMSLDELEKARGGEQAWEAARPGMEELNAFIAGQKQDAGPFILGKETCYADFMVAAMVEALRRISEDLYAKVEEVGGRKGILEVHAACREWFVNDQ